MLRLEGEILDYDKRQILSDYFNQLEENISELSMKLENNEDIRLADWKQYEKCINDLYSIINMIIEEI